MAIAKMDRVFIIGVSSCKEDAVSFLQEAGVVHIETAAKNNDDLEKEKAIPLQNLRKISQAIEAVKRYKGMEDKITVDVPDGELVSYTEERLASLREVQNGIAESKRLIESLSVWGDFDPDDILKLEGEGLYLQRFYIDKKKWEAIQIPKDVFCEVVNEKNEVYFFTIASGKPIEVPGASPVLLPKVGLKKAQKDLEEQLAKEAKIFRELSGVADKLEVLSLYMTDALNHLSYVENAAKLYSEEHIFGLQGWLPRDIEGEFLSKVEKSGLDIRVEVRDPLDGEEPPILLKNNWFMKSTAPLLRLYGLPKFRDIDPSYFFAPFMILFFGICFGDAGYGLVFFLLSWWTRKKWGEKVKGLAPAMRMCEFFAISTMAVGLITGSVFGYNFVNRDWIMLDVSIGAGDPMILFYVSLGLGVLHLSVSYILGMMDSHSSQDRLQKLGVLFVLWGGVSLVSRVIWFSGSPTTIGTLLYYAGAGFLSLGILLTLLFATDNKNWGIRLGLGLWNVYGLSGLVGDLLSYARLFGLGMATSAIASVMNQLGMMVKDSMGLFLGTFFAIILIILGHVFNFALSVLGSVVHSARLHFVEAFKSFFQGGGIEYKPFKIERG